MSLPRVLCRSFISASRSSPAVKLTACRAMSSEAPKYNFETLNVTKPKENVLQVELNRPDKRNAMNQAFWREMVECFTAASTDSDCRAIVISGAGKIFTAGLDLMEFAAIFPSDMEVSRKGFHLKNVIADFQETFTCIEKCPKPVIAAVHNACVGGGIDMITACDIRYCSNDAWFQVKEVDIGLAADVGTLQRLPKITGNDSLARELAYTARKMMSDEALKFGLVSRVFPDRESTIAGALETAALIASKSPVAVQGSKVSMVYSRDHSVAEGLLHVATWNQCMLQSEDVMKAAMAMMQKEEPVFSKL